MKIAVVGCGAVGSFYGAKLACAGHEVHFLLRSDYDVVSRQGVFVHSPEGDFQVRPRCARYSDEIGPADLVLIGLKTTGNDQFGKLLPALVGPATVVLTLQNGLGNEEQLARLFPAEQIMGGLCFVCLNRIALCDAGVPCAGSDNLARAHWEKMVWNIPFNGLGVAGAAGFDAFERLDANPPTSSLAPRPSPLLPCLTTDKLLADARWGRLVRELMLEVIAGARALGFDVPDLFLEPLRQATQAGLPMPRLAALCAVLMDLERAAALRRRTADI
ncbi:MAG: 2-dehydropantoate 2-reductase [Verrucomicrobia bacterium]|nr:2-dehydropantoate 2-reductase [Verrucomicrobiota bacterium]